MFKECYAWMVQWPMLITRLGNYGNNLYGIYLLLLASLIQVKRKLGIASLAARGKLR